MPFVDNELQGLLCCCFQNEKQVEVDGYFRNIEMGRVCFKLFAILRFKLDNDVFLRTPGFLKIVELPSKKGTTAQS